MVCALMINDVSSSAVMRRPDFGCLNYTNTDPECRAVGLLTFGTERIFDTTSRRRSAWLGTWNASESTIILAN